MLLTPRQAQFAFVPAMVTVMSAVISFATALIHHGVHPGLAQAWLHNWRLAFVIALPVAWLAVPVVRTLLAKATRAARDPVPVRSIGEMG